jgi:4-amino-4-deoxy-L-arabinose transferase-like glycosyltransferase
MTTYRWLVVFLLILGVFFRFYRIEDTLMFQGDQGRDALVIKRMIVDRDLTLLGPITSVGNMYLGPFYYYFMLPFFYLTFPNPVGPAMGVALADVITMIGVYVIAKKYFGQTAGIFSLALYSFFALAVEYARFSWNPNIAPLFGLATFYFAVQYSKTLKLRDLALSVAAFGILIQLHYVALSAGLVPLVALILPIMQKKVKVKQALAALGTAMGVFFISLVPLLLFNLRHNNLIVDGFLSYFGNRGPKTELMMPPFSQRLLAAFISLPEYILGKGRELIGTGWGVLAVIPGGWAIWRIFQQNKITSPLLLLITWLLGALIGMAWYTDSIYDHYLTFVFPALAIGLGCLMAYYWKNFSWGKLVVGIILVEILALQIMVMPTFKMGGPPAYFYREVVTQIAPLVPEGNYNIALLADNRDYKGLNYRYFFEISPHPPQREDEYSLLEYLVVIDEQQTEDPLQVPIYEIQAVGDKELIEQFTPHPGLDVFIYQILYN